MLTFVIPTHRRPNTIEKCIRSIASQVGWTQLDNGFECDVRIKVIDDHSPPETVGILYNLEKEYPFLSHRRMEVHGDYSTAFREMFCEARDSDWVWTFGDDDILLPGALGFILKELVEKEHDLQFVHVAETRRAAGTNTVYRGRFLDLCNSIGWIEMTGFITCNITRGERLWRAAQTPRWNRYAKSSFVQSAALLEELRDDQCAFFDFACVEPQREGEFPEDTMTTWREQNIDVRYQFAPECIEAMFEEGILHQPLTPKFYRYLSYDLPGRLLSHFGGDYLDKGIVYDDMTWARVHKLALFLGDEAYVKQLHEDIQQMRDLSILHAALSRNLDQLKAKIAMIAQRRNEFPYPYSYIEPPKPAETVDHHPV